MIHNTVFQMSLHQNITENNADISVILHNDLCRYCLRFFMYVI